MPFRVVALLLAVLVVAGVAAPTALASPDVAVLIDDGVDGARESDPAIADSLSAPEPAHRELRQIVARPGESQGRLHLISVFRPPRLVASR